MKWKSAKLVKGFAFGKKKIKKSVNLKGRRANWCEICADNKLPRVYGRETPTGSVMGSMTLFRQRP